MYNAKKPVDDEVDYGPSRGTPIPQASSPTSYANRAASAIKASNALARFGKALYGSSAASTTNSVTSVPDASLSSSVDSNMESKPAPSLRYLAKSGIIAMAPSSDRTAAAIAGKDFFQVLKVGDESITQVHDLRGSGGAREFEKIYSVTALRWGKQRM
jgi:hypothetical protein